MTPLPVFPEIAVPSIKEAVVGDGPGRNATYQTLPSCPDVERQRALLQCAVLKQAAAVALQENRPESAQHLLEEAVALLTPFRDHPAKHMSATLRREQDQIARGEVQSSRKALKHQSSRTDSSVELTFGSSLRRQGDLLHSEAHVNLNGPDFPSTASLISPF